MLTLPRRRFGANLFFCRKGRNGLNDSRAVRFRLQSKPKVKVKVRADATVPGARRVNVMDAQKHGRASPTHTHTGLYQRRLLPRTARSIRVDRYEVGPNYVGVQLP